MTESRHAIEERRDRALDDLLELRRQVEAGELDDTTAAVLEERYRVEAAAAIDSLAAMDTVEPRGRSMRRTTLTILAFSILAVGLVIGLVKAVQPRDDGFTTGDPGAGTVDLDSVSNADMEAVIADNPDILPMRLALARRYLEEGDFSAALPHYLYVLEREENAEALMYLGWMTHVSGDSATGVSLLERSLEARPGDPLAEWFLANALFYGLGDRTAAIPLLESVIASGEAPPEIVAEAQRMLDEARAE